MRVKLKNRHVFGVTFLCRALHAVICITQFTYYLSIRSNYLNLTHLFWASNIYMIEIGVLFQQFPIMYSISQLGSSCELNIFLKLIDNAWFFVTFDKAIQLLGNVNSQQYCGNKSMTWSI